MSANSFIKVDVTLGSWSVPVWYYVLLGFRSPGIRHGLSTIKIKHIMSNHKFT